MCQKTHISITIQEHIESNIHHINGSDPAMGLSKNFTVSWHITPTNKERKIRIQKLWGN